MNDSLKELIELLKINRKKSFWAKEQSVQNMAEELISEVKEFEEALTSGNKEHLKHELGDILMDLLHILLICEEQGYFTSKEAVQEIVERLKWRKPFLVDGSEIKNKEEEYKIWNARKAAEQRPEEQE
ncbi:hypothetical protein J4410_00915 [Candidatus Woesearchaeota archaeon]|nr:hypothetical protein [Candidatus Woesearchaeota archaeon]